MKRQNPRLINIFSLHINHFKAIFILGLSLTFTDCQEKSWEYEELLQTRTNLYEVKTSLPKVAIEIPDNQDISQTKAWFSQVSLTIYDAEGRIDYQDFIQIKTRGNLSWFFPKKPYALKLPHRHTILGMPSHKRWCLLANWVDRTLIRNDVAFKIASEMPSLEYTPHGRFVEVFLNGYHMGNYYLCEQIRIDPHRVDITEPDELATSGWDVTGGYIFEIDNHFDELFRFISPQAQLPWMVNRPDELSAEQFTYIQEYVADLEDALFNETRFAQRDFARLMDLESFADWWLVHELTSNGEARHPRSCFMYKDQDTPQGKAPLKAGPVWDFDCETYLLRHTDEYVVYKSLYYPRLFQDKEFCKIVQQHWDEIKKKNLMRIINTHIDSLEEKLRASDAINSQMWPITNPLNQDYSMSQHDAIRRLKSNLLTKYLWLDNAIQQL